MRGTSDATPFMVAEDVLVYILAESSDQVMPYTLTLLRELKSGWPRHLKERKSHRMFCVKRD